MSESTVPAADPVVPPPPAAPPPAPATPAPPAAATLLASAAAAAAATTTVSDPPKPPAEPVKEAPKPAAPVELELKLPEGAKLDPALLGEFKSIAKEHGVTSKQAQAFVDWQAKVAAAAHSPEAKAAAEKAEEAKWAEFATKQRTADLEAIRADPKFGGAQTDQTLADARSALKQFFGEEVSKELTARAMDNHPGFVKGLAIIRRALSEDSTASRIGTPAPDFKPPPMTLGQQLAATIPKRKQ